MSVGLWSVNACLPAGQAKSSVDVSLGRGGATLAGKLRRTQRTHTQRSGTGAVYSLHYKVTPNFPNMWYIFSAYFLWAQSLLDWLESSVIKGCDSSPNAHQVSLVRGGAQQQSEGLVTVFNRKQCSLSGLCQRMLKGMKTQKETRSVTWLLLIKQLS